MWGVTGWDDDDTSEPGVEVPECVAECVAETAVPSVVRGLNNSRNLGGGRCGAGAANGGGGGGVDSFRLGGGA